MIAIQPNSNPTKSRAFLAVRISIQTDIINYKIFLIFSYSQAIKNLLSNALFSVSQTAVIIAEFIESNVIL